MAGLLGELAARVTGKDYRVTRTTMRLMHIMTPLDYGKAERELGWTPRPLEEAVTEAATFFTTRRPRLRDVTVTNPESERNHDGRAR